MDIILVLLNLIGTAAFSVSGALTAIKKELDLLGVIILGTMTAVGGGILRDIVIGKIPPDAFVNPTYTFIAFITSIVVFFYVYFKIKGYERIWGTHFQRIILLADTIGLAFFTVIGVKVSVDFGDGENLFLTVFLGTITGVGGGIIRDLLAGDKPYILCKHIYACASIAGAIIAAVLWDVCGEHVSMIIGAAAVVIIRFLAIHFEWNLPKIRRE